MLRSKDLKDAKAFQKLGVKTLLDLALIIPHSFENTIPTSKPIPNTINVVKLTCKGYTRRSTLLQIDAYAHEWEFDVRVTVFNPKPFHYAMFKEGESHYVSAKVEYSYGKWQLVQPIILKEIGSIRPKYKTILQSKTVQRLMGDYVCVEALMEEGVDEKEATLLVTLHQSTSQSAALLQSTTFDAHVLPVLKSVEILNYLQKLSRKKVSFPASSRLLGDNKSFIKTLPFTLTNDQLNAIEDIRQDLQKPIACKRVVMGDVGCGKTMVILASVMMALPKRAVLMVPTTILARQIYEEALKFLPLHVKVSLVMGKSPLNEPLEDSDFIIGTHALLYQSLPVCDLVMIDEQHRFGTKQRELIHKLVSEGAAHPHFIQFTATPIPRTMSMIHSSLVEYSFIKEMPFPKDIDTFVIGKSGFKSLVSHIEEEIAHGHQIAIIYPLVEESEVLTYQSIDEGRGFWEKRFEKVYVTHGKDKDKEAVLEAFREGGNILIATTVVEVGISLPRLSTIVIVGAERLGLATLHQLRGRVSRTGLKGYCYLFTHQNGSQRLNDFTRTSSGFDIAELDLKYRQSGDLLSGTLQHGVQFHWFSMIDDGDILERAKKKLGV